MLKDVLKGVLGRCTNVFRAALSVKVERCDSRGCLKVEKLCCASIVCLID